VSGLSQIKHLRLFSILNTYPQIANLARA
jgi:hypothetical protein